VGTAVGGIGEAALSVVGAAVGVAAGAHADKTITSAIKNKQNLYACFIMNSPLLF
jgi:hypothetical protein